MAIDLKLIDKLLADYKRGSAANGGYCSAPASGMYSCCRAEAIHKLLFTSDALFERLPRFHLPTIDGDFRRCPENWTA